MHLVAILIFYLDISYTLCRSVTHKHHGSVSQSLPDQAHDGNEFEQLKELLAEDFSVTEMQGEAVFHASEDEVREDEASMIQESSDISKLENSEIDMDSMFKSKEDSRDAGREEDREMLMDLNREKSYFLTENNEVYKSVDFYYNMITLFQNEIKEFAEKDSKTRQHRRKHRKPSLRPKRSLRSLLKDLHIKDILMQYFQQKQKEENGKPLLRYG